LPHNLEYQMVWHLYGPVQVRLMEFCCTYNEKCKVSKNLAMTTLGIAVLFVLKLVKIQTANRQVFTCMWR